MLPLIQLWKSVNIWQNDNVSKKNSIWWMLPSWIYSDDYYGGPMFIFKFHIDLLVLDLSQFFCFISLRVKGLYIPRPRLGAFVWKHIIWATNHDNPSRGSNWADAWDKKYNQLFNQESLAHWSWTPVLLYRTDNWSRRGAEACFDCHWFVRVIFWYWLALIFLRKRAIKQLYCY